MAALGYFVDILDLFLFSVLRVPSLKGMGVSENELFSAGILLLNCQMAGLLLGSIFWGVLGDRKGRVSVLYGSILIYSLATIANAFVKDVPTYAFMRFISGLGLAGELGLAITLVTETLSTKSRGIGTTLVAGVGLCGGIAAAELSEHFSWQNCYLIGGCAGLLLLFLRIGMKDSELFQKVANHRQRGNLLIVFKNPKRLSIYLQLILVGLPIWFVSGILMVFSPEFGKALNIVGEPVRASQAVMYSYMGMVLGDFVCGFLSQTWRKRKGPVAVFIALVLVTSTIYLSCHQVTTTTFYVICFALGIPTGYWAVLITMAAEHFGTDMRATVTTTVPNFIRASTIPMTFLFSLLRPSLTLLGSAAVVGTLALGIGFIALYFLDETFDRDLNFTEGNSNVAL